VEGAGERGFFFKKIWGKNAPNLIFGEKLFKTNRTIAYCQGGKRNTPAQARLRKWEKSVEEETG
jgi:hypothetical protein